MPKVILTPKKITNKADLDRFYKLKEEDITFSFIVETLGNIKGKSNYNAYDELVIPPNTYGPEGHKNKNSFTTTIGLWIFNKLVIEKSLFNQFHYVSYSITKKSMGRMISTMSYAIMEEELTNEDMKIFLKKTQFLMRLVSVLSNNDTENMLLSIKEIGKEKERLLKLHKKELDAGNELVMEQIEKQLVKYAEELLQDDPAFDIYASGMVSFGNNFKNMYIMKGMVKDPDPRKGFDFITTSYMEGISKEDYPALAKSQAAGAYSRGKLTAIGGYMEKLFVMAFQHIRVLPQGSDCGTKRYMEVTLNKSNISNYMYSYIIEGSKLVELTSKNKDKYIGKTVKFRFSHKCEAKDGICSKCAGNLFYRLGIDNAGMTLFMLASTLKVINMKAFHDSQVSTTEMDPMKAFGIK